jgi:hypothetical protein
MSASAPRAAKRKETIMHCSEMNSPADYAAAYPEAGANTSYMAGTTRLMQRSLRENARGGKNYGWANFLYTAVVRDATRGEPTPDYATVMENVAKEYGPKALNLLSRIRQLCRDAGLTADNGPYGMSSDDYSWVLTISHMPDKEDDNLIDITVGLYEERDYDSGNGFGLNFGITIVEYNGRELGQLQPYNYTESVWVDARDPVAVAARWQILDDADIGEIPKLILARA